MINKDIRTLERKEDELKKQGASKEDIQQLRQMKNALGVKIANKQNKARVKLLKEEDVPLEENDPSEFEPKNKKKVKLSDARKKAYGLE